jgi:hypothetical protein
MWTFGAQGDFRIARSRVRRVVPTPLEDEFKRIMSDPRSPARFGLVAMFRERLVGPDLGVALTAWQNLSILVGDDSSHVVDAARDALVRATLRISPSVVELTTDDAGAATGDVELDGPPLLLVTEARTATPWLQLSQPDDRRLLLEATPPQEPGVHAGVVRLSTPIGQHEIEVRVTVPSRGGRRWLPRLVHSRAARYAAAVGVAVLLVVVGAAVWLWPGGGDRSPDRASAALPTGPALPTSALLWVREEGEGSSLAVASAADDVTTLRESEDSILWPVLLPSRKTVLYITEPLTDPEPGSEGTLRVVGTDGRGDRTFDLSGSGCDTPGRPSVNAAGLIALTCFDPDGRSPGIRIIDEEGRRVGPMVDRYGFVGNPAWAAQGRYLVYWRADDATTTSPRHIYVAAADGSGDPVALTTGPVRDIRPAVSPSGTQVVFRRQEGETVQLFVMEIGRDDPTATPPPPVPLDGIQGVPEDPGWTSDGKVMYTAEDGSAWEVDAEREAEPTRLMPEATASNAYYLFGADR